MFFNYISNWWNRECGGWEVLRLAAPMIVSSGSFSLMTFTDRVFLMWVHQEATTASMQAGLLFWMLIAFPVCLVAYVNAFVSQYHGSHNDSHIGVIVWQGVFIGAVLAPFYVLAEPLLRNTFFMFGHANELIAMEQDYLRIVLWSAGPAIASEALCAFFYGREKMSVVMYVNLACAFINVVLDYCWIFGHCGLPEAGLAGAAYATVTAQWLRLLILTVVMFREELRDDSCKVFEGFRVNIKLLGRLLYYGCGSGASVLVDTIGFTVFVMMIASENFAGGGLGKQAASATSIAFTLNMFSFMPIVGTGVAVTTLVGNQLGNNRSDLAERATKTALTLTVACSTFFALLYLAVPNQLLYFFTVYNTDVESFESIRSLTINLLRFISLYLLFDTVNVIFSSAIKGAGDTWFVTMTTLIMMPFLPILTLLGFTCFGLGIYWAWSVLSAWIGGFGLIFWMRFHGGKWKQMRVIESDLLGR
ncbi:MAG: MATE family efflux transporter [Planctomycetaceae bacterium]|jgi:MATE family multidrug resistance protein|nr:MATE family efflux transporter [Planctomycetaceae bacterium]